MNDTCEATLTFTNTSTDPLSGAFYFDVLQGGVVKDQVIFQASSVAPAASGQDSTTVLINQAVVACGTFTLQFNAAASDVFRRESMRYASRGKYK